MNRWYDVIPNQYTYMKDVVGWKAKCVLSNDGGRGPQFGFDSEWSDFLEGALVLKRIDFGVIRGISVWSDPPNDSDPSSDGASQKAGKRMTSSDRWKRDTSNEPLGFVSTTMSLSIGPYALRMKVTILLLWSMLKCTVPSALGLIQPVTLVDCNKYNWKVSIEEPRHRIVIKVLRREEGPHWRRSRWYIDAVILWERMEEEAISTVTY